MIVVNHTYKEIGMFPKDIVGGGTGSYYSADNIFILGRQQEKEGTEITGYNFIINVEKSRYVKEKSKIPVSVSFDGGISKWSGLLDIALDSGHVIKPSNGWYSRVDTETGEVAVHDNVTPGGNPISSGGGGSNYSNVNVKGYLTSGAFDGNLIPSANNVYSIGSLAHQWKSIYVSTGTIYINGVPQLPAQIQMPAENTLAAKLEMEQGDEILSWRGAGDDTFIPIVSWNDLRWRLLDAITAEKGFSLELEDESGERHTVEFKGSDLPRLSPNTDPFAILGILPIPGKNAQGESTWFELQLDPIDSIMYATERVWLITKVSTRMMIGLITGETSLKQLSGPISIADMAGKSAQFGWQSFLSFLALLSISIGLLNLVPLPMLDGGQLLYDAWELLSGRRISVELQGVFQRFGFILIIALTIFALFNDLQRFFPSS